MKDSSRAYPVLHQFARRLKDDECGGPRIVTFHAEVAGDKPAQAAHNQLPKDPPFSTSRIIFTPKFKRLFVELFSATFYGHKGGEVIKESFAHQSYPQFFGQPPYIQAFKIGLLM